MFKKILIGSSVFLGLLAGCTSFMLDPYITVKESPLNWIEIHYYNTKIEPTRRISVRLTGDGFVELKKGTSDRVSNDFARDAEHSEWRNYKTQHSRTSAEHAKDIMQNLVNYGVLDPDKTFKGSDKEVFARFIAVKANISNYTYSKPQNIYEVDPELAEQLYDVIREFDNPTL